MGSDFYNLTYENLRSPIYISFIISAVIVLISFLGCCGTCNENPCMIKAYAGLILVCVVLQVAVVVLLYKINPDDLRKEIKTKMFDKFIENVEFQRSIQIVQQEYKCCGFDSWRDYGEDIMKVPDSCCGKFDEKTSFSNATGDCQEKEIAAGCKKQFVELFKENSKPLYITIGLVFGLQLLVIILSCALSKSIREQYNVV